MATIMKKKKSALRQTPEEKPEDLLVFGYGSRIFRDDEKALFIDQGKHLIAWNGVEENGLMIDRYDVRAFLTDLTEYDADIIRSRSEPLTEKERQIERLLDEERYLELTADYDIQMMFEEEEMKRSQERFAGSYAAVGFQYESAGAEEMNGNQQGQGAASTYDELFVPIPALKLPSDMIYPRTMKVHAIIEKTATFICKQGTQMEIVLKTKQKDNPQFEFLNYDNELNPYFKHLVCVMKDGRYIPAAHQPDTPEDDSHYYLHPSLMSTSQPEPELAPMTSQEFLESIKSKLPAGQIANTSYQVLLKNLQKHAMPVAQPKPVDLPQSDPHSSSSSSSAARPSLPKLQPPPPPPPLVPAPPSSSSQSPAMLQPPMVESGPPLITPPPPDQKPIIDKMADYVARNGPEFEACVKLKNDPRFRFLDQDHVHHNYYLYKKDKCIKELEKQKPPPPPEQEEMETEEKEVNDEPENDVMESLDAPSSVTEKSDDSNAKAALTIKGVSFSIKPKEDEVTSLKTRTALLYDSSDEDDSNSDVDKESQPPPTMSRNSSRVSLASTSSERPSGENAEKKQAEQRLADKLANAAREKLARESRDRQLQAQRKRKAALFINMLKDSNSAPSPSSSSGPTAATVSALADCSTAASTIDSPFTSSTKSGSATPTALLEQAALDLSRASVVPASVPSRARSRSPRKHRRRSVTPPSAYTSGRRSASKSPSRHMDHSQSKHHRSKHSNGLKQKSPSPSIRSSSHKKSTKDRESSKHKKSKKSKSKHRRSDSWEESDDDARPSSSKRPRVASSISKVNPIVVDLTGGSPRAGEDGSKRSERGSKHSRR